MPESVRDRPTKAHEQVFLLTKSGEATFWQHRELPGVRIRPEPDYRWRHKETGEEVAEDPGDPKNWRRINLWAGRDYFYDAEAVREAGTDRPPGNVTHKGATAYLNGDERMRTKLGLLNIGASASRNLRSVWTIATEPLPSIEVDGEKLDHFAYYPVELARRCILAGTSAKGCCQECGAPWARVMEPGSPLVNGERNRGGRVDGFTTPAGGAAEWAQHVPPKTTGWRPTCSCLSEPEFDGRVFTRRRHYPIPCRVLDPFGGSGRTALAAEELGRDCTLVELSPKSVMMARAQIERAKARRMIGDAERVPVPDGQMGLL
jgi:hypothetical protein